MEKLLDLHIHTNMSDGVLSPKEVIDEAYKNGVSTIAIADHDTIDAYTEDLYNYAQTKNIQIINAVEISTKKKCGIHVLGYNFNINNQELKKQLSLLRNARHNYLYSVAQKLQELGYIINIKELNKITAVTKAHISLDVISNPNNHELLLKNFTHIPNKEEFIETVMNEGCPAYVKKTTITPKKAAELIHQAGGKVILAHPVAYTYEDNLSDEEIIQLIKEIHADGIEANYIYIDHDKNEINDIDKWTTIAKKNNLLITTGSDFHSKDGIHPEIGLINNKININNNYENIISSLLNN